MNYDSLIQKIKNHETLGEQNEAEILIENVYQTFLKMDKEDFDNFYKICHFLSELKTRRKWSQFEKLINDLWLTRYAQIDETKKMLLALEDSKSRTTKQFYCCQNCGELKLYLATPCDNCSFLPENLIEVQNGIYLSTEVLTVNQLLKEAAAIRLLRTNKKETKVNISESKNIQWHTDFLDVFENILSIAKKCETETYRRLENLFTCPGCGHEQPLLPSLDRCGRCNGDLNIPVIKRWKISMKMILTWITDYVEFVNEDRGEAFIQELLSVKLKATEQGVMLTAENGIYLQHLLELASPFKSKDGSLLVKVKPYYLGAYRTGQSQKDESAEFFFSLGIEELRKLSKTWRTGVLENFSNP